MVDPEEPNAAERRRWNDERWTERWPKREALTGAVTGVLLDGLGPVAGQRLLDVGAGGGGTSIAAGRLVGDGAVVGADISAPLVRFARDRAAAARAVNVSFVVADVQCDTVPGGPFDAALSQFGVMFFDEPSVAFANIRNQLVPGGRLAFACWQPPERNPWFVGPMLAEYLPPPPPPAPGKSPTGPFSLSDPDHTRNVLAAAGWRDIAHRGHEVVVTVDRSALADDDTFASLDLPAAGVEQARRDVDARLDRLRGADGRMRAPLAFWVVTATA